LIDLLIKAGDQPALCVKRGGVWISWTYKEYLAEVRTVAKELNNINENNEN